LARVGRQLAAEGLGVHSATGRVFATEPSQVDVFLPGPTPRPPHTDEVTQLTATTATLNGDLNPEGQSVGFYFSYGLGSSCTGAGAKATAPGAATGSVDVSETAQVTGLQPNAPYAACILASSEFGVTAAPPVTFTTPSAKPSIDRQGVSAVTLADATLEAEVNPNNQETHYEFEYGPTAGYGHKLPAGSAGAGYGDVPASADIGGGLSPAETYHYRTVATNATGTTEGPDQTFTTLPLPPTVTVAGASAGADAAIVTFTAGAQGAGTEFAVRYGTNAAYTAQVQGDAGRSRASVTITAGLAQLVPGTTYHYSVRVQNAGGEAASPDAVLTTAAPPAASPPEPAAEPPVTTPPLVLGTPLSLPTLASSAIAFPVEPLAPAGPRPVTRAHRLAQALRACRRQPRRRRPACVRRARARYGRPV
jgi:hypothetical protein